MSAPKSPEQVVEEHPNDTLLRADRIPHIWCPGCGIGSAVKAYAEAIDRSPLTLDEHVVVSGIGCTGRSAGYINVDSYHTTHGRAIPYATGIKVANPDLEVAVFSGDGDLFNIGGNHFIHAARRNLDMTVLCVNNFNYGMTGGQFGATTPQEANTSTTPHGNFERSFNLPRLAASLGVPYVARWSTLHPRRLARAIEAAMAKDGLGFVEVISPCPPNYGKRNGFPEGLDFLEYIEEHGVVDDDADLADVGIDLGGEPLVVGDFVDEDSESYLEVKDRHLAANGAGGGA
ncbi:MAG: thiamine pyrophosphate-dependent enzyme [Halobacteriales archaeon]